MIFFTHLYLLLSIQICNVIALYGWMYLYRSKKTFIMYWLYPFIYQKWVQW